MLRKTPLLEYYFSKIAGTHSIILLTLFRMGLFATAHGCGRAKKICDLPKICHTYPTMMKLGTVIAYPKKIHEIYKSRDTPPDFC